MPREANDMEHVIAIRLSEAAYDAYTRQALRANLKTGHAIAAFLEQYAETGGDLGAVAQVVAELQAENETLRARVDELEMLAGGGL